MTVERVIRIFAAAVVLVSLVIGAPASPLYLSSHWLWLTNFVGLSLFQCGITRFCPLEIMLKKAGLKTYSA